MKLSTDEKNEEKEVLEESTEPKVNFLSKNTLQNYCVKMKFAFPIYSTEKNKDGLFVATIILGEEKFPSKVGFIRKKDSEFYCAEEVLKSFNVKVEDLENIIIHNEKEKIIETTFKRLPAILEYFNDGPIEIVTEEMLFDLFTAFTHSSLLVDQNFLKKVKNYFPSIVKDTSYVVDYNRLEFLGDSIIESTISKDIYNKRKNEVDYYNKKLGVGEMTKLRTNRVNGKRLNKIMIEHEYFNFIMFFGDDLKKSSIPGDVLEAIIGAISLHLSKDAVENAILNLLGI